MRQFFKASTFLILNSSILLMSGCINDQGLAKNRGVVTDQSVTNTSNTNTQATCAKSQYVTIINSNYSCTNACASGYHVGTSTEVSNFSSTVDTTTQNLISSAKGVCISDISAQRPTGQVYVDSGYCSCLNGKADIINDCDAYCANSPITTSPILHITTTLGSDIANNTKLGNLNNWCTVQLSGDTTAPQCFLSADDGVNVIDNIPVSISKNSNTLTADISSLSYNTPYVVKIYEGKTGSDASSTQFQLNRIDQSQTNDSGGTIKLAPISQYTCLTYGGSVSSTGVITRSTYARVFYYYPANEVPAPIPAAGGSNQSQIVCHDEVAHGFVDNALFERLEHIPALFTLWDKSDSRFVKTNNIMDINSAIQSRLKSEYNVTASIDLFSLVKFANRPNISSTSSSQTAAIDQGYMMIPFIDSTTNKAYCPTDTQYNGSDAIFKILKYYMGNTEGLYLSEKEPETIQNGSNGYTTVYGTMFATETMLTKYGFYLQNGIKTKVSDSSTLHTQTIYYYWPASTSMDPLLQGDRKLYTVRYWDQLNGNSPSGVSTSVRPSDKRIGCVPKTTN
jgi:hypothetical protein